MPKRAGSATLPCSQVKPVLLRRSRLEPPLLGWSRSRLFGWPEPPKKVASRQHWIKLFFFLLLYLELRADVGARNFRYRSRRLSKLDHFRKAILKYRYRFCIKKNVGYCTLYNVPSHIVYFSNPRWILPAISMKLKCYVNSCDSMKRWGTFICWGARLPDSS